MGEHGICGSDQRPARVVRWVIGLGTSQKLRMREMARGLKLDHGGLNRGERCMGVGLIEHGKIGCTMTQRSGLVLRPTLLCRGHGLSHIRPASSVQDLELLEVSHTFTSRASCRARLVGTYF